MKNSKSKFKTISLFLLLSFLLKPLWLFDKVDISVGDDLSYWIHASTLAFDFDFDYIDDHSIQNSIFNKETNAPEHPPGAGYLSSVFVFVFSLLDRLFSVDLNVTENQIGTFSYAGYFASTLFFTYFGFKLINKISVIKNLLRYKKIVLLMSFLSTLVHYSTTRFLMSHAHEFFLVSFIIYNFEKNDEIKKKQIYLLSIGYFLLSITRPSTFLITLFLISFYFNKFDKAIFTEKKIYIFNFVLVSLYIFLANKLYNSSVILLNLNSNSTTSDFTNALNLDTFISGISKIHLLFFSFSGGLLWTAPVVLVGIVALIANNKSNLNFYQKISLFFYIFSFFVVALFWQGYEAAYGQRLFIGLIPFLTLQTIEFIQRIKINLIIIMLNINAYLNYLYFYSSAKLTLRPGLTLWGSNVKFSSENYTYNLYTELFQLENIFTIIVKSIYSIILFSVIELEKFLGYLNFYSFNQDDLGNLKERTLMYSELSPLYLFLITIIYFFFISKLIKLFSTNSN